MERTEAWEVGDDSYLPGYPSVVKNNVGDNPDGKFIFYAVQDLSGIALAVSRKISGPFTKIAAMNPDLDDSRVLSTSPSSRHFSPVVIWNPVESLWHMYFHLSR